MWNRAIRGGGAVCWVLVLAASCQVRPVVGGVMAGKINVYNLGERGVVLDKAPTHVEDGEFRQAQNAIVDPEGLEGGIRKRGGLTKINSSAIGSGSILGLVHVPLPDPGAPYTTGGVRRGIYLPDSAVDLVAAEYSTDGTTWNTNLVTNTLTHEILKIVSFGFPAPPNSDLIGRMGASAEGRLYFGGAYTIDSVARSGLLRYDGRGTAEVFAIPAPPQSGAGAITDVEILGVFPLNGKIYVATRDGDSGGPYEFGRAFEFDPASEQLVQLGSSWGSNAGELDGGVPAYFASYLGRVWVATVQGLTSDSGRIYSIRPGIDEDWTLEDTATTGHDYSGLAVFEGELYATTFVANTVASSSLIRKRTSTGTWSTVRTNASSGNMNCYLHPVAFNGKLYVVEQDEATTSDHTCLILEYDGTTFSTSRDVRTSDYAGATTGAIRTGYPLVIDDALFWGFPPFSGLSGNCLLRNVGAGWTNVRTTNTSGATWSSGVIYGALRD